jgi:hypothetical protein
MLWFHLRAGVRVALGARCPQLEILDDLKLVKFNGFNEKLLRA